MAELRSLGKVIETDVLVVGHGCAGLAAAQTLLNMGFEAGLIPHRVEVEFLR